MTQEAKETRDKAIDQAEKTRNGAIARADKAYRERR